MQGAFDSPIRLPDDLSAQVAISGPLLEVDPKAEKAKVLFLVVQNEGPDAVTVQGEGSWHRDGPANMWFGKVDRKGKKAGGGEDTLGPGLARGIGLAIAVKEGRWDPEAREFFPPTIEALTWCANFRFE